MTHKHVICRYGWANRRPASPRFQREKAVLFSTNFPATVIFDMRLRLAGQRILSKFVHFLPKNRRRCIRYAPATNLRPVSPPGIHSFAAVTEGSKLSPRPVAIKADIPAPFKTLSAIFAPIAKAMPEMTEVARVLPWRAQTRPVFAIPSRPPFPSPWTPPRRVASSRQTEPAPVATSSSPPPTQPEYGNPEIHQKQSRTPGIRAFDSSFHANSATNLPTLDPPQFQSQGHSSAPGSLATSDGTVHRQYKGKYTRTRNRAGRSPARRDSAPLPPTPPEPPAAVVPLLPGLNSTFRRGRKAHPQKRSPPQPKAHPRLRFRSSIFQPLFRARKSANLF